MPPAHDRVAVRLACPRSRAPGGVPSGRMVKLAAAPLPREPGGTGRCPISWNASFVGPAFDDGHRLLPLYLSRLGGTF